MKSISLNCDLGESFGAYTLGNDEKIIPLVDAVNIACGFHAGDARTMQETVRLASKHQVKMGAHPGFDDLQGFGRRKIDVKPREVYQLVLYQIGALHGFVRAIGESLHHVKPHGALYNMACQQRKLAEAVAQAVYDFQPSITLFGLSNSELTRAGEKLGLPVAHEVFADRTYQTDGSLTPRTESHAMIKDVVQIQEQVKGMVDRGVVKSTDGKEIPIQADTICVHGDTNEALQVVQSIREVIT
ncbi:hypothetical protein J416_00249 [Gracilibacillus halophilus YIM-C55.5]|uniref:5-oxoprolinase subunit A n=1 Tax=Gracilibacillus halophilus YIM-C55.5 TaxID=1308866 RepID=N4WZB1_9BACI|nr:5-oxoprolinase subunit PxpA [Gracilibacillus halophilus]ENH98371.1 hypothetical protein J416_00249 [Gracilibacillus halophilus YIM-C55.5]